MENLLECPKCTKEMRSLGGYPQCITCGYEDYATEIVEESISSPEALRGKLLFTKLGCNECHRAPLFTSPDEYDVGLEDESGQRKFNPPTLHGVSQRDHFFHDGSAGSIAEVLGTAGHPDGGGLTSHQRDGLVAYLRSL